MHKTSLRSKMVGDTRAVDIFNEQKRKEGWNNYCYKNKKNHSIVVRHSLQFPWVRLLLPPPPAPTLLPSLPFQKSFA